MSIEIQCMTEKLIVITIKLDYSKVPSKSTVPTTENILLNYLYSSLEFKVSLIYCVQIRSVIISS